MRPDTLVYDCFSGISGDMHIGAMLDLGVDADWLVAELGRLPMAGEFALEICRDAKHGISGTRANVRLEKAPGHHRHLADIEEIIRAAGYSDRVDHPRGIYLPARGRGGSKDPRQADQPSAFP